MWNERQTKNPDVKKNRYIPYDAKRRNYGK